MNGELARRIRRGARREFYRQAKALWGMSFLERLKFSVNLLLRRSP